MMRFDRHSKKTEANFVLQKKEVCDDDKLINAHISRFFLDRAIPGRDVAFLCLSEV